MHSGYKMVYFILFLFPSSTDLNVKAAMVTGQTSEQNGVDINPIVMDLVSYPHSDGPGELSP